MVGPAAFADPYGDFTGTQAAGPNSFAALDTPGPVGPLGETAPGLSRGTDVDDFLTGLPDIVTTPDPFSMPTQALTEFELGEQGRGPASAVARGPTDINPNDLPTIDDPMSTLTGFPSYPATSPSAPADAKGIFGELNPNINTLMEAISNLVGPNQAQAQTSQFGPMTSDQIAAAMQAPTTSQQGLANTFGAMQQSNVETAQTNPGLAEAVGARGLSTDPEATASKGPISVDPEAPGRTMDMPHTQPSIEEFFEGTPSISRGAEMDPGRTMAEPHTQPSIEEFFEGTPSISRSAEVSPFAPNPYADNPDVVNPANPNTSQSAPAWTTTFGDPSRGLDAPTNWGPTNAPTAEQLAAARDAMVQQAMNQEAQNPLTDVFGRDVTNPSTFAPTDPGRTMEAPHNQPSIEEFFEGTPSISRSAEVNPLLPIRMRTSRPRRKRRET